MDAWALAGWVFVAFDEFAYISGGYVLFNFILVYLGGCLPVAGFYLVAELVAE